MVTLEPRPLELFRFSGLAAGALRRRASTSESPRPGVESLSFPRAARAQLKGSSLSPSRSLSTPIGLMPNLDASRPARREGRRRIRPKKPKGKCKGKDNVKSYPPLSSYVGEPEMKGAASAALANRRTLTCLLKLTRRLLGLELIPSRVRAPLSDDLHGQNKEKKGSEGA